MADSNKVIVTQQGSNIVNLTEETVKVVSLAIQGPPGPPGVDKHYVHDQASPTAVWTVIHNLGKNPAVVTVDTADRQIIGAVEYINVNQLTITFSGAVAGKVYLN